MANELTITWKANYAKSGTDITFPDTAKQSMSVTITGTNFLFNRQTVGTSEEAILLGDVPTGGFFLAVNRDATNFVSIRQATGGTNFVRLNAGEGCFFRIHASSAAPFAIADTAAVELEYLIIEA